MTAGQDQAGTFRDPAGSLRFEGDQVIRTVRAKYAPGVREWLATPLRAQWEASGELVPSEIHETEDGTLTLLHPRVPFPTYPWEWTPGQWRAAAELTLKLQREAVAQGWILKDATPLNILFAGPKPVLVDVLSFERRDPRSPVWLAYGQFVRTFLLPLLAWKHLGWPLTTMASRRDGFEAPELYRKLSFSRRWVPELMVPVTLPAMLEKKGEEAGTAARAKALQRDPEIATQVLVSQARGLAKRIRAAAPPMDASAWAKYEATAGHYSAAQIAEKQRFVSGVLNQTRPATVLDIGANTGTYSLLAAAAGAEVVALEGDTAAADRILDRALAENARVMPLVANMAWPTPAYGWENSETRSLLSRLEGRFDLVLMLAVVHHLLLHEQIPLDRIAAQAARLTTQWLLLEWVPVADLMFQKLLRGREDLYGHMDEQQWQAAAGPYFETVERQELSNGRVMFLYRRR